MKFSDEDLWHERLLTYPGEANAGRWFCIAPDSDKYVEDLLCHGRG